MSDQKEPQSYRAFYESHAWEQPTEKESLRLGSTVAHVPSGIESILEIGCGDGRLSSMLPQSRFVGVDYSFSALQNFRARWPLRTGQRQHSTISKPVLRFGGLC